MSKPIETAVKYHGVVPICIELANCKNGSCGLPVEGGCVSVQKRSAEEVRYALLWSEALKGSSDVNEFNDNKIVCVLLLDPPELGAKCCRCQLRKTLHWCVEEVDGCWGTVCHSCGEILLSQLKARGGLHV